MRQRSEKNKRFLDAQFQKLQEREMLSQQEGNHCYYFSDLNRMEKTVNYTAVPSQKEKENLYDISFQAKFMSQHESALKKEAENFMESCIKEKDFINLGFQSIKNLNFMSFQAKALSVDEKISFASQIKKQQKLVEFLKLIQQMFEADIANEIQYVVWWAWKRYVKISDPFISEYQLIEKGQKFAKIDSQRLFSQEGIKFINLQAVQKSQLNEEDQIKRVFCEFIQFLYITVFLIIEGYFQNPYATQSRKAKRIRNIEQTNQTEEDSWCQEINYYPTKKIFYL